MIKRYNKKKNIFCLEGDWNENLKIKSSILPALQLLEINNNIDTIYRNCSTFEEFCSRLNIITGNKKVYKNYDIVYLAFHGAKNQILIGNEFITLETISEYFDGKFEGKIIHFGSCKTLSIDENKAKQFLEKTGAIAISGYEKTVPFISSTLADVVYFELCQKYVGMKTINDNMMKHYGDLVTQLKFKMFYR